MSIKRRNLLFLAAGSISLSGAFLAWRWTAPEPDFLTTFCDTILPADPSPSASATGAHLRILERAQSDDRFAQILETATSAIDALSVEKHGKRFVNLKDDQRGDILATLGQRPDSDLLGWFFRAVRGDLFFHHYAQPDSWGLVGLSDTPQPVGFYDVTQPWNPGT